MKARLMIAAALTVVAIATAVAPASADPTKPEPLELDCTGLGVISVIVAPGAGRWTPGLVANSTAVGVPYEFHITGTFTDDTGTYPITEDTVKRGPNNGRSSTCTWHEEFEDENGTVVIDGIVKVSISHL